METVFILDEPEIENSGGVRPISGDTQRTPEEEEEMERIEKSINDVKAAVSETLEDGERLLKRGRYAVEDRVSEFAHKIKQHPFSFLGIAFACGAAFGLLASRPDKR